MNVTIRHCNCLKGPTARVRAMLIAEGFNVGMVVVRRPMTLQVNTATKKVWSYALWRRRIPDQKTLARMIRESEGSK